MNFVLNDSTPSPAPVNGCCSGIPDTNGIVFPQHVSMKLNGAPGSGTEIVPAINGTVTVLYYVGTPGDLDGITISSGTWTIPIHVTAVSGNPNPSSVWISRADSSGNCLSTIGHITVSFGVIGTGVTTFSVTGVQTTFATGNVVIISFGFTASGASPFTIVNDQTVIAPGQLLQGIGATRPPIQAGWYKRRLPVWGAIPGQLQIPFVGYTPRESPYSRPNPVRNLFNRLPPAPAFHPPFPLAPLVVRMPRARPVLPRLAFAGKGALVPQLRLPPPGMVRQRPIDRRATFYHSSLTSLPPRIPGYRPPPLVVRATPLPVHIPVHLPTIVPAPLSPPPPPPPPPPPVTTGPLTLFGRGKRRYNPG